MDKNIVVEREMFESKGKSYYSYFIKGTIRGKEVRVNIVPPDSGGYKVLDIVFGNEMQAKLVSSDFEITDQATGKIVSGTSYLVTSEDEDGTVYECKIKPARNSDKTLLNMLVR